MERTSESANEASNLARQIHNMPQAFWRHEAEFGDDEKLRFKFPK